MVKFVNGTSGVEFPTRSSHPPQKRPPASWAALCVCRPAACSRLLGALHSTPLFPSGKRCACSADCCRPCCHLPASFRRVSHHAFLSQLERSSLSEFMPSLAKRALMRVLDDAFPTSTTRARASATEGLQVEMVQAEPAAAPMMAIGDVTYPVMQNSNKTKVPKVSSEARREPRRPRARGEAVHTPALTLCSSSDTLLRE